MMRKSTILMIEAQAELIGCLGPRLQARGCTVISRAHNPEVPAAGPRKRPDLVILNIGPHPDESCLAARSIQGQYRRRVPIVCLTGRVTKADCERAFEEGIEKLIPAPWGAEELLAAVEELLDRSAA